MPNNRGSNNNYRSNNQRDQPNYDNYDNQYNDRLVC